MIKIFTERWYNWFHQTGFPAPVQATGSDMSIQNKRTGPIGSKHASGRTRKLERPSFFYRSLVSRLALFLGSLIFSLLVIEVVFRISGVRAEFHEPYYDHFILPDGKPAKRAPFAYVPHAIIRSNYDSNPRGYFDKENGLNHRFNSAGWRDREHSVKKPKGTYRILGLGDSYLFGQGVRLEHICLARLEQMLNRASQGPAIETISMAVRGYNTVQECQVLRFLGMSYEPDLVILHFVLNDVERTEELFLPRPKIEFTEEFVRIYDQPDALSHYSFFWGWARQTFLKGVTSRLYLRQCLQSFHEDDGKWEQCRQALSEMQKLCDDRNVPLLVVIFPFFHNLDGDYPFQPIHDVVSAFCQTRNIHVLDLRDYYGAYRGEELWVHPTDQHPNEIAHEIAARAVAKYLAAHPQLFPVKVDASQFESEASETP